MSDTAPAGNLTQDNTTNNPPAEKVVPPMPVPPDLEQLEAAIRGGEHAKTIRDAEAWIASADRAPAEIPDEAMAAKFANTISNLIKARTGAEKIHAGIKKPWFDATKVIDAIFLTGIGKRAEVAQKRLEQVQKVWIAKQEKAARDAAAAEALKQQQIADQLRQEQDDALRAAERQMDQGDMQGAEMTMAAAAEVEQAATEAEEAVAVAEAKVEAKPADLVRTHHASGVTTSAKKFWTAELLPLNDLKPEDELKFWRALAPYIAPADRLKAAKAAVKAGLRVAPGLKIFEDFNPINR